MTQISRKLLASDTPRTIQHDILWLLLFQHIHNHRNRLFVSINIRKNSIFEMSYFMLIMISEINHHRAGFVQLVIITNRIQMLTYLINVKSAVIQSVRKNFVLDKD